MARTRLIMLGKTPLIVNKETATAIFAVKEYLAKGKRGFIYFSVVNGKKYVVKMKNPSSDAPGTIRKEAESNERLNSIGIGPKFHYYDMQKDFLVRDFVSGERIYDWIKKNKDEKDFEKRLRKIFLDVLCQCKRMDEIGLNKLEMTNPYKDILVTKDDVPMLIDFERCKMASKPKNVTQFIQFMTSSKMRNEVGRELFDARKLLDAAREYKKNSSNSMFDVIKNSLAGL